MMPADERAATATEPPARTLASRVTVVDFNMPFGSMIVFMLKWALAAIPAMIVLIVIGAIVSAVFAGAFSALVLSGFPGTSAPARPGSSPPDLVVKVSPVADGWQVINENGSAWQNCSFSVKDHSASIPSLRGNSTVKIGASEFSNGSPSPSVMELDITMFCRAPQSQYARVHLTP